MLLTIIKMIRLSKNRSAFIASLFLDNHIKITKVKTIWSKYETGIRESVKIHGPRFTLERYKLSYLFLRNYILKLQTQPIPWCKVDSNGIPKTLWLLRPLIKGSREDQRVALTIARSYELIKLPITLDRSSIEGTSCESLVFQETRKGFKKWLVEFVSKYPWYLGSLHQRNSNEPRVFTTLSNGPNGPAVACAHLDAKAVLADNTLFTAIKDLNSALGQDWIT